MDIFALARKEKKKFPGNNEHEIKQDFAETKIKSIMLSQRQTEICRTSVSFKSKVTKEQQRQHKFIVRISRLANKFLSSISFLSFSI